MNDFAAVHLGRGYDSDPEKERRRHTTRNVQEKQLPPQKPESWREPPGFGFLAMNAADRHRVFIGHYLKSSQHENSSLITSYCESDMNALRKSYRFLGDIPDGDELAKKYYERLFREYAIADLSRYKEGKVGLRWRSEKEVIEGKGQFICGSRKCSKTEKLSSYEMNFAYSEDGISKNALVKVRLCKKCAKKLRYISRKRKRSVEKKETKEKRRRISENGDQIETNVEENVQEEEDQEDEEEKVNEVWLQKPEKEMTCEEEFDDYFSGMFP